MGIIFASKNWNATPCGPENNPEQEQEDHRGDQKRASVQEPSDQRKAQNLHAHQRAQYHRDAQNMFAMLDMGGTDDGRDRAAQLLERKAQPRHESEPDSMCR